MSDTNRPRLKVSRAGIVLIKSFESFRPRAVMRDDGRWVIGYGHTASAREGLTVGEQDAELLLQYDLMPVVKALNDDVGVALNQHQFDALASFAVSVGVERFLGSDVRARLNAGHAGEAADALVGWPETQSPDSALRRRAAERALFVADPASPVLLAELLAAPLPPPPVQEAPAPEPDPALSRAAAVASLLGETHAEPVTETPEPEAAPEPTRPLPLPDVWQPQVQGWSTAVAPPAAALAQRYSPYSASIVGPLPGFPPAEPVEPEPEPEPEVQPEPTPEPVVPPEPEIPVAPETPAEPEAPVEPETPVEAVAETPAPPVHVPVFPPAPVFAAAAPSAFPPLELTPAVEADFAEPARAAWPAEERAAPVEEETVLFEEEPPLAVLRHEVEPAPKRRVWVEAGPYMIMGGLGLLSCAVSAAAFRRAVDDPLPMNEFTVIAWVLALIGVICVGVSAWNLYGRATKGD